MIVVVEAAPDDVRRCAVDADEHADSRVVVHLGEAAELVVCRAHATPRTVAALIADESAVQRPGGTGPR